MTASPTLIEQADLLEVDFGVSILSNVIGEPLSRNGQVVRLADETRHSAEHFYFQDSKGKPYVFNFQTGKRTYPLTAYQQNRNLEWKEAVEELTRVYIGGSVTNTILPSQTVQRRPIQPVVRPIDSLSIELLQKTQTRFEANNLVNYLKQLFSDRIAGWLIDRYQIGSSKRWRFEGGLSTVFPQIDHKWQLRQLKVMCFHPVTGRRLKEGQTAEIWSAKTGRYFPSTGKQNGAYFAGKSLSEKEDCRLVQCFFGEHLLAMEPDKSVCIVEAESTALVASVYFPDFIWLATGGCNGCGLKVETAQALKNRSVVLYPDLGKYPEWQQKARQIEPIVGCTVAVSDYLESNAPEEHKIKGNYDLRDYLIRQDVSTDFGWALTDEAYPVFWDSKL